MTKRSLISGNYQTKKEAEAQDPEADEEMFEKEALKRLGGSIAFVRGRKLVDEG